MSPPLRRAAIVSTGTEILQGLYADSNGRYLAERLSALGLTVTAVVAAPDDVAQAEAALRFAASDADIVICSGGLGPTEDDVNREAFARVFGCRMVLDERALEMMRARFVARNYRTMPEQNARQAMVPDGATVFYNEWGTAPGYFFPGAGEREDEEEGPAELTAVTAALIALPGPPKEMIPMFETAAEPVIRARSAGSGFVSTRTIHTFGLAESSVNEVTRDLFSRDPWVTFTILAKLYGVDMRVTARGATLEEMSERLQEYERLIAERIDTSDIYGSDEESLASVVARLLIARKETLTTAESCTGGLLAKLLTDLSGSSAYFGRGYVTYADEAKEELLGVRKTTLKTFGAVSAETAREMATGARERAGSDYALAITGVAGPTGGTPEKPVGLVYIALASAENVEVREQRFLSDRDHVRLLAALTALDMLRKQLRIMNYEL